MTPHPTHSFYAVGEEGVLCRDCDVRQSSEHAGDVCPEFQFRAVRAVREAAFLLFMSMPIAPAPAHAGSTSSECRNALDAGSEWAADASLRAATCRTLAQLVGVETDVDASLIQMSRA